MAEKWMMRWKFYGTEEGPGGFYYQFGGGDPVLIREVYARIKMLLL